MGARFVRLGIAGFKSFADQVSLELLPGLTGIVGPNGCGKSNVADALRWAMGEANPRHLRGGEMDDVIFAGAAHRPSRNLAEVALTIEADSPEPSAPFAGQPELTIVRRIERGAGSTYRLNGREARARDVQTLFADLASGARSSALVSQGRVSSLVNARPEDRRAVLEEAAGITGLHARRAEAETRLRAAEANIERAEERRALLERQLDSLRAQAKQATRYRTVVATLLDTEATALALQAAAADAASAQADAALLAARQALDAARHAARAATAQAEQASQSIPALRDAEAAARTHHDRARLALEGHAAERARAEAALAAAAQRQSQIARDTAHAESVLADSDRASARLSDEESALQAEDAAHPAAVQACEATATQAAAALHDADEAERAASAALAEAGAHLAAAEHRLHAAQARAVQAADTAARLARQHDAATAALVPPGRLEAADRAAQAAVSALETARAAEDHAEAERARTAQHAATARSVESQADAARHKLAAEHAALAEVLDVRDGERWPALIDTLAVPPGLETALGAALGDELAAAADPGAARHWRTLPAPPGPATGLATQIAAPPMLGRALSAIRLVESEAEGDADQPALRPGETLVSLAGAVWRWDGYTIRAGTPTAAAIRLRQRNRLAALAQHLAAAEQAATAAHDTRAHADHASREATAAEAAARQSRRASEAAADAARTTLNGLRSQADIARARFAALQDQLARAQPDADHAAQALAEARRHHAALPCLDSLRAASGSARTALQAARTADAAALRALETASRNAQHRRTRLAAIAQERIDRRMRHSDMADRAIDLRARASQAAAEIEALSALPARTAAAAGQAAQAATQAEAALLAAESTRRDVERAQERLGATARQASEAESVARDTLTRAEIAAGTLAAQRAATHARIDERRPALPPLPAVPAPTPEAEERARTRLQRLTRERDEIGPVNLRADIEADAIGSEIAAIVQEREELGTAIAKLRGSIGHLNREGRERLTAVFQSVDRHFQSLFATMFGGGRAHLSLVGSDDPLQAGLEIYAQPPGKKLSTLSLLSGGEQALTAISLVFAVFRCNPAPLCLLDEVDAPLDDANVERLCTLLAEMARGGATRFLVVTHNQVTMSRMDRLYGVTMQERGVSRLLSVDLSQAVDMVEAIAAE